MFLILLAVSPPLLAQRTKARNWTFTIHLQTNDSDLARSKMDRFQHLRQGLRYLVFQLESAPTTGIWHIQGSIGFENQRTLSSVKTYLGENSAHLEISMGTPEDNRTYCTKVESRVPGFEPFQFGDFSVTQGSRCDLRELYLLSRKTHFLDEVGSLHPEAAMRWQKAIQGVQKTAPMTARGKPTTWFIFGDTGTGKTRFVMEKYPLDEIYKVPCDKHDNVWFDGYAGQRVCLFDDWRSRRYPIDYMLQVLDRYPVTVPVKGGYVPFISSDIFITTNTAFDAVYPEETCTKTRAAFERRFDKIVEFTQLGPRWIKGEEFPDNQAGDPLLN